MSFKSCCLSAAHLAGVVFKSRFTDGRGLDAPGNFLDTKAEQARFGGYRACHAAQGVYRDMTLMDIDSAYPWAMARRDFPGFFGGSYARIMRVKPFGLYRVSADIPNASHPLFLQRTGRGSLSFRKAGHAIFWVSGVELLAFSRVYKSFSYRVLEGWIWKAGREKRKPLQRWSLFWHAKKKMVDKKDPIQAPRRQLYKNMLNHITGKFDSMISEGSERWLTADGYVEVGTKRPGMLKNFFVAVFIRALPRVRTWEAGIKSGSLFEMTDSLVIPSANVSRLKPGEGLGRWGIECRGDLIFWRPGTYLILDPKTKKPVKVALHGFQGNYKKWLHAIRTAKLVRRFNARKKIWIETMEAVVYKKRMFRVRECVRRQNQRKALCFEQKKFVLRFTPDFCQAVKTYFRSRRVQK